MEAAVKKFEGKALRQALSLMNMQAQGKADGGALFVVTTCMSIICLGMAFVGGDIPSKFPKSNAHMASAGKIISSSSKDTLQLLTFKAELPKLIPTIDPKAPPLSTDKQIAPTTAPTGCPAGGPVVVLDPGHSGSDITVVDPATGLNDHDYPNIPEITEVFTVAQQVQTKLQTDGYTVIMTKSAANDYVSLRARADMANNANAAIAVSLHNDHGQAWGNFQQIYVQKVGNYRTTSAGKQITFTNAAIAQKSQAYGNIFQTERTAAEGKTAEVVDSDFNNRPGIDPGNIPQVELYATVPWVYNEVGASGNMTQDQINRYAKGVIAGIEKSVPKNGTTGCNP